MQICFERDVRTYMVAKPHDSRFMAVLKSSVMEP